MGTAADALVLAASQIGYQESPAGSNRNKFGAEFGLNGVPWCVEFVWAVLHDTGTDLPKKTAGVYDLLRAFKAAGRYYTTPQPGDVVFWSYGQGHAEFVESFDTAARILVCVGGNTSAHDGSPDNGGEVARNRRVWGSQCLGFGRPSYSITPPPPPTEDGMADALVITYPTGAKTVATPDGAIFNAGTPFYGSIYDLPADQKQGVTSIRAITAVDPNSPAAGYVAWAQNGNPYRFDAAEWKKLGH